jgi:hypothetical protein
MDRIVRVSLLTILGISLVLIVARVGEALAQTAPATAELRINGQQRASARREHHALLARTPNDGWEADNSRSPSQPAAASSGDLKAAARNAEGMVLTPSSYM